MYAEQLVARAKHEEDGEQCRRRRVPHPPLYWEWRCPANRWQKLQGQGEEEEGVVGRDSGS